MSGEATRRTEHITIAITGFGCGGGGSLVAERAIARVPGVVRVYVNPATEMAYVEYDPQVTEIKLLTAAVEQTGLHVAEPRRR